MRRVQVAALLLAAATLAACGSEADIERHGAEPGLPEQQTGLLPDMRIADPVNWNGDLPTVPPGYTITAIATDLKIPRQILVLPNGDILVAEGTGDAAPKLRPKDVIAGFIKSRGKTDVEGGDRITLLRDTDGDGMPDARSVFIEDLNAPYGLAFVGGALYVANQDALLRFPYTEGQTRMTAPASKVTDLPSHLNHHWTKALAASVDGARLYVGIGSNSNVAERGMAVEAERAMVWEVDPQTGARRQFATGLRNPSALAVHPETGALWAAVNERDELGPDLAPDYITSVRDGGFYGWPYSYWGRHVDPRVRPQDPEKVASAIVPDYSLGSHVAPLGLAFSSSAMGQGFAQGVFVGEHGSWNRREFAGYKVTYIPFQNGRPSGKPVDFVSGFLNDDGKARGRPVGVTVDPRGALLVADDLSNTVWRIAPQTAVSAPDETLQERSAPL